MATNIGGYNAYTPGVFQADATGTVTVEAEHYTAAASAGGQAWYGLTDATAAGGLAMQTLPHNNTNIDTNFVGNSPRLDYPINLPAAGTYRLSVRLHVSPATPAAADAGSAARPFKTLAYAVTAAAQSQDGGVGTELVLAAHAPDDVAAAPRDRQPLPRHVVGHRQLRRHRRGLRGPRQRVQRPIRRK